MPRYTTVMDGKEEGQLNVPYLVLSALAGGVLLVLLAVYRCRYYPSAPIANVIAFLLTNELLQMAL